MVKKVVTPKKKLTVNSIISRKPRRAAFSAEDAAFLNTKPKIELKNKLGGGYFGEFYTVEGNDRVGVKVPECILKHAPPDVSKHKHCKDCFNKSEIKAEGNVCKKRKYNDEPLIAPTRFVTVEQCGQKCLGLARPILQEINAKNAQYLTNSQLETIRRQLIELAKKRIAFKDYIQGGLTPSGKFLQYDMGHVDKVKRVSEAFWHNQESWYKLLYTAHKFDRDCPEAWELRNMWHDAEDGNLDKLREAQYWQAHVDTIFDKYGRVA